MVLRCRVITCQKIQKDQSLCGRVVIRADLENSLVRGPCARIAMAVEELGERNQNFGVTGSLLGASLILLSSRQHVAFSLEKVCFC
jgi:hypothetical protein